MGKNYFHVLKNDYNKRNGKKVRRRTVDKW